MPAHHLKNKISEEAKALGKVPNDKFDFMQNTLEDWLDGTTDIGDDEEEEIDSCSTFSLQQCIDEFRARRIRRNSAHVSEQREDQETESAAKVSLVDADLINQNRSNKEHERKHKPCKNGFCYCFTSDSGDGGGCNGAASVNTARGVSYMRYARRSRKSESAQHTCNAQQSTLPHYKVKERRSAPASLKSMDPSVGVAETIKEKQQKKPKVVKIAHTRRSLKAVSSLVTTTHDAPLIHIIQELRDNCVVSEVRVNKHKLQQKRIVSKSSLDILEKQKTETRGTVMEPTAPPMEKTTNANYSAESKPSKMDTVNSIPVSTLEIKSKSPRRKPGAGRLLQKRLSNTNIQYKHWDMTEPPPKPPRASTGSRLMSSNPSLTTSTSSSIREAERIVDDFLIKKGVSIPKPREDLKHSEGGFVNNAKAHMSSPHALKKQQPCLPTCPSLSDIERIVDTKPRSNYGKNMQQAQDHQVKDISLGWKESKVSEMLNYDSNGNRKEFKSQSAQAEPQSLGWHIPPKLQLDTVDGAVRHNLAANLETKDTPVKRQFSTKRKEQQTPRLYPKFGWRNLSPWTTMTAPGARMSKCPKGAGTFLKQSKKKILRLVTPKKDNREHNFKAHRNTPYRTVGIQTSLQDLGSYANSTTPQSPPGSYHSAVQTMTTPHQSSTASNTCPTTQSNNPSDSSQFDFTRKVNSPPKKAARTSQRKLDFPTVCGASSACFAQNSESEIEISKRNGLSNLARTQQQPFATRTYRSYQTDLDEDATVSKMGFILSNIRARLEASDERAVRTFEEIERREQLERGFDCPDSFGIRQRTSVDIHSNLTFPKRRYTVIHEPIYSEIEEDSIHVTESPQFDNKTGIESSCSASGGEVDFETLYAKVNKTPKKNATSIPLGQFLHDSLQSSYKSPTKQLPVLPEPSESNVSYSSPPVETSTQHSECGSPTPSLMHCQSLNNIRVMEHNSPPNRNRNSSKSDLSLQRSEIFLENLCRSELIVEGGTLDRIEKVDNLQSKRDSDYISYDVSDEFDNDVVNEVVENVALTSTSSSPQKFLTKPFPYSNDTQVNETQLSNQYEAHCSSCPVTPQKCSNPNELVKQTNSQPSSLNNTAIEVGSISSAFSRYKRLKQALQNSLRKSKNFVKSRRASLPLNSTQPNVEEVNSQTPEISAQTDGSCLNLDTLFAIDENVSVTEQIARAVSICRQLPELETTQEMVEAERLLLYTTLRHDNQRPLKYVTLTKEGLKRDFSINTMRFPVNFETNMNDFFNYYLTVTFESGGEILSTQSTECRHGEVIFRLCNIDFNAQKYETEAEPTIHCNVFMLRLRKISTQTKDTCDLSPDISPLTSTPVSSSSSLNGITSRFRLYGSFTLEAKTFKPFVPYEEDIVKPNMLCLRASNTGSASLKLCSKRASTDTTISIDANVTAYFAKTTHSGFLHVQDPFSLHNWNRRWCNLNGLQLEIWTDMSSMNESPLLCLNLYDCKQTLPLEACAEELCARKRSFCVQCSTSKAGLDAEIATVFFAAENEKDLDQWLQRLNETLSFIATWMQ